MQPRKNKGMYIYEIVREFQLLDSNIIALITDSVSYNLKALRQMLEDRSLCFKLIHIRCVNHLIHDTIVHAFNVSTGPYFYLLKNISSVFKHASAVSRKFAEICQRNNIGARFPQYLDPLSVGCPPEQLNDIRSNMMIFSKL